MLAPSIIGFRTLPPVMAVIAFAALAQALARDGYLVASVEHVGDTWQDQSMRASLARYFAERPRQASRAIDTLLADTQWRARIANGADGRPLIGALGHSAGGYTVLALAGGNATLQLVPNAGHYAFMNTPTMDLPSPDGSVAGDPPGFDRAAFLGRLAQESIASFNKNLR